MVSADELDWPKAMEKLICKTAKEIAAKEMELFQTLANCRCCYRHMINRPRELYKGWDDCISANPNRDKSNGCACHCRHTARMIARFYSVDSIPWHAHYKDMEPSPPERPTTNPRKLYEDPRPPGGASPEWRPGWHNY
jgi:hypothetical protein